MSRRARALGFLLLALAAAALAAALADSYGARVASGYGPLRPVVVVDAALRAGVRLGPAEVRDSLSVRRIPERFVPFGALSSPVQALGLTPGSVQPAGSYLLATQLASGRRRRPRTLATGRRPVEISVNGAGALLAAGAAHAGARVDVVVTNEADGPGTGRTYVAAASVPLLALRPGPEGPGGTAAATLGLTRREALRLIAAESFARKVTVMPGR